uniref:F-box domain-containing protein n=2 Tax=Caenorhabditis tropicalis TaxID=1561998 RepID=A0A1I7T6Y1_9PELO
MAIDYSVQYILQYLLSLPVRMEPYFQLKMASAWKPFPLLSLPPSSLNKVLQDLNCVDLIDFSLLSKRCKRLVQKTNHRIDGLELSVMAHNSMIVLKSGTVPLGFVDFQSTVMYQSFSIRFFNQRQYMVCKIDNLYYCRNHVTGTLPLKPMSDFLMNLFRVSLQLSVISDGISLQAVLKDFEKCEALTVSGMLCIGPEDMWWLMEKMKPNGRFTLGVRHYGYFLPPEVPLFFDVDHLEMLQTAEWMTRNIFLRLFCKRIFLSYCHLKPLDFEHFVSQWYHSERKSMEYLEVWHKTPPGVMNFQHLNPLVWDPWRRAQFYNRTPQNFIDCTHGIDIIRKDGSIATIIQTVSSFHFIVWKDRFPPFSGSLLNLY